MNLTKAKTTILVGVAAILLTAALGWNFLLSPRQSEVSDIHTQTVAAAQFNQLQLADLEALRLQAENLPAQQLYAEGLTAKFPATAAQPILFAEVQAAAARAGLSDRSVISLTPSAPLPGTTGDAVPLPVTPAPANAAEGTTDAVAPVAPPEPTVASMQLELTVTGPYDALLQFIAEMENNPRAYLVSTVDLTTVGEPGATAFTLTLTGTMFVLPPLTDPTVALEGS